jgi:uncharacterized protein
MGMTTAKQSTVQGRFPMAHDAILGEQSETIAQFCQQNYITKLSLFGSVLRDDFSPESDIDILVEFEPGKTPGWAIVRMQTELSAIFGGRTVDLRTPQELSRYFRDRVMAEAVVQYVKD